jgi:hypothetical protein
MSKSKQKGTSAETAVVKYLKANGFPRAERRALQGNLDKGDISGVDDVVFEVKDHKKMELSGWVKELVVEVDNADAVTGAVIHKETWNIRCWRMVRNHASVYVSFFDKRT